MQDFYDILFTIRSKTGNHTLMIKIVLLFEVLIETNNIETFIIKYFFLKKKTLNCFNDQLQDLGILAATFLF